MFGTQMSIGPAVWMIAIDRELDRDEEFYLNFPQRICISRHEPTGTIDKSKTRVAGCIVDIRGKPVVIAGDPPSLTATGWNSSQPGQPDTPLEIRRARKLGHVLHHPRSEYFLLIDVADTFKVCPDRGPHVDGRCTRPCSLPPPGNNIYITTMGHGSRSTYVGTSPFPTLSGFTSTNTDSLERLSLADSGSLVSVGNNQHIGIAVHIDPTYGQVRMIFFDNWLLAYLTDLLMPYLNKASESSNAIESLTIRTHIKKR